MALVDPLPVDYFDGHSGRARPVLARIEGDELLLVDENGLLLRRTPVRQVVWPERQRHGQRQAQLPGEGLLAGRDAPAWDAWAVASGLAQPAVVGWQQSWGRVFAALVVGVVLIGATWRWGLPWAAERLVAWAPQAVLNEAGVATLRALDHAGLEASRLPTERQAELSRRWHEASDRVGPVMPATRLVYRRSARSGFGPNALALPDGTIVLTDELVDLLAGRDDVLIGVLGHEAGHVQQRHGLRMVMQSALVGMAAAALIGDFSTVLAGVPVMLSEGAYSREMEREADMAAVRLMHANAISPAAMVTLFERLAAARAQAGNEAPWETAFASHPADEERMRFFREAAAGR